MRLPVRVDIAIVNYRSATDVRRCLDTLGPWECGSVWLVDNSAHEADCAADTAALQQISSTLPWVTLLTPGSNLGFGRACNLAFEQSSADFFLLLNPDAQITNAAVLQLAYALAEKPQLGAVSPKIFWNDERSFVLPAAFGQTPWHSVALALATRWQWLAQWGAQRDLERAMRQMALHEAFSVAFLAGSVLMLRRAAVLEAGGLFDPDYFMFFEDSDLSLRLRRSGFELAIVPSTSAVHAYRHRASKGALMAQSQQQYFGKQFPLFYRLSAKLARLAALARPVPTREWFRALAQPVGNAGEFGRQTGGAPVLALSPSMLMMPAMFRPSVDQARCLNEREWALLEPAAYVALLVNAGEESTPGWVCFERAELHDPAHSSPSVLSSL